MRKVPYSQIVGLVTYTMVSTILDVAYAISFLNRFMVNIGKDYWVAH